MFHSGRKATPKSRDDQGPTNQRVGMAPSSRRLHVSRKSPGAGYQGRTATRASQVSRVTARAPALRLPSLPSILLSFSTCLVSQVFTNPVVLLFTCLFRVSCFVLLSPFSVSAHCCFAVPQMVSLMLARRARPFAAAHAAGQRAPAAHEEVRSLSQGQCE